MERHLLCSVDPLVSTLSLDDARTPAVWGRNAGSQSVSRMAVRQGRPWSDNAWSPDAPEQVSCCADWDLCNPGSCHDWLCVICVLAACSTTNQGG